jgi:hypothetical protein
MSSLTLASSITFIIQFVELAQKNGVYVLAEADTLQKAVQSCQQYLIKPDVTEDLITSLNLLINGVVKGQSKGSYSLAEASLLYNIVMFFQKSFNNDNVNEPENKQVVAPQTPSFLEVIKEEDDEELYELSDPVPISNNSCILEL